MLSKIRRAVADGRRPAMIGVALLITGVFLPQTPALHGQTPAKASTVVLYHVVADDSAKTLPKDLTPYRAQLLRVAKGFRLEGKKSQRLSPGKASTVELPAKLGRVTLTMGAKGTLTVKLVDKKGKSLGTYRSSRLPVLLVNDRLKIGGKDYVLVIDRPRSPKPRL